MPRLTIDGQSVETDAGATILDAARRLGIHIPTLCFTPGCRPETSCFVCVVKVKDRAGLVPACATKVADGMEVQSETPAIREARRTALELLLSDHLGDCLAPCQLACPAAMNIPLMIRQIGAGNMREAIATIKNDIALPAVLGRICAAPCEKACRRGDYDAPVAICLLKRHAADIDLSSAEPWLPVRPPATGRRVAVVGAGPAGLAAAFHLLRAGHACSVFDSRDRPGGALRDAVPADRLPRETLDAEIRIVERLGAEFRMGITVGRDIDFETLVRDFHAVVVCTGEATSGDPAPFGLAASAHGIAIDRATQAASRAGVFAGGDAVRPTRMAVRSVADGKAAAASIHQYLSGVPVTGIPKPFSTHVGRLRDEEKTAFMGRASPVARVAPAVPAAGLAPEEARSEAARCLHCDCLRQSDCRLRDCSALYSARPQHFKSQRRTFERAEEHPAVVYEAGKCIACGLCVQITAEAKDAPGLAFVGRGFGARVRVPFRETMAAALAKSAAACVAACPTGALAWKEGAKKP